MLRHSDPHSATTSTATTRTTVSLTVVAADSSRVGRNRKVALPLYGIPSVSSLPSPPTDGFTISADVRCDRGTPQMRRVGAAASSSSSPPTPSPLSTSASERDARAAVGRGARHSTAVESRRAPRNLTASASIHAVSEGTACPISSGLKPASMPGGAVAATAQPPDTMTEKEGTAGVAEASLAPSRTLSPSHAVAASAEEAAKEAQRQQILGLANALLTFCSIGNTRVTSIRQCTSSFFVLLYQRLFDCTIPGIDRSPNTAEKRRHNVTLVLEQLRQHPYSLENIEAEEVVKLNEDHISRLIMVFVQVAEDMRQQREQLSRTALDVAASLSFPEKIDTAALLGSDAASRRNSAAVPPPSHSAKVPEEYGGMYAPKGYTVAEVMQPTASSSPAQRPGEGGPGITAAAASTSHPYHHYPPPYLHQATDEFYVAAAPPLNGSAVDAAAAAGGSGGGEGPHGGAVVAGGENESPSSVSYYLDSSAIPTDDLLEEWYRNLVYPPPGVAPAEETEVTSAMDPGHVSLHRDHSLLPHARSDRLRHETGVSLTSSGTPQYARAFRTSASPPERWPHHHERRSLLNADDIVHRCHRLEEALDVQEKKHHQAPVVDSAVLPQPQFPLAGRSRDPRSTRTPHPQRTTAPATPQSSMLPLPSQKQPLQHRAVTPGGAAAGAGTQERINIVTPESGRTGQRATSHGQAPLSRKERQTSGRAAPRFVAEPPLTRQERDLLAHRSQQCVDAAQRDRKIERLRAARHLGDMQQLLRQRMRREYDHQIGLMRGSLKDSIRFARAEKSDLMRRVRDENERYRAAYTTLMEAAANEAQVPVRIMSRHTEQLANFYATSLQHSKAVCEDLKREADRHTKEELLRYAEQVSAWQQHILV